MITGAVPSRPEWSDRQRTGERAARTSDVLNPASTDTTDTRRAAGRGGRSTPEGSSSPTRTCRLMAARGLIVRSVRVPKLSAVRMRERVGFHGTGEAGRAVWYVSFGLVFERRRGPAASKKDGGRGRGREDSGHGGQRWARRSLGRSRTRNGSLTASQDNFGGPETLKTIKSMASGGPTWPRSKSCAVRSSGWCRWGGEGHLVWATVLSGCGQAGC